jgi:hypothetical protein
MQLFSIGLWMLNNDGSPVVDSNGNFVQSYTNDDILMGARCWTGFGTQVARSNTENPYLPPSNSYDPVSSCCVSSMPLNLILKSF